MKKGSYLLRFVDVVLILLFGFIAISDISEESVIELPKSSEMEQMRPAADVILFLSITPEGSVIDEERKILLRSEKDVVSYVRSHQQRFGAFAKVRIRANYNTKAEVVTSVATICDQLGVKKSIEVEVI